MKKLTPEIGAIVCLTALATVAAGAEKPAPRPSLFQRLFPHPTGTNGYEELILAADTLRESKLYDLAEAPPAWKPEAHRLEFKRKALSDPPVARALTLIRQGLSKPIRPLRRLESGGDAGQGSRVRRLMRLLILRQYVLLADGRVREAVEVTRLGLRLGELFYVDPQISGLLGVGLAGGSLRGLAPHLGQLSASNCEQLYQMCLAWLRIPTPERLEMEAERRALPQTVAEIRAKLTRGGLPALEEMQLYEEEIPTSVKAALAGSPAELDALFRQVAERFDTIYGHYLAELDKPPWQREWTPPEDGSPGAALVDLIHLDYSDIADTYTQGTTVVQLFACHSAVRRYRWEHGRYPADLVGLRLGDVAIDPFTGLPFQYEFKGSTYRLYSSGPKADYEDPSLVDGRRPLSIVPGEL